MAMYFITTNYSLAFIPKVGCSSLSRAVIKQFQPEDNLLIVNGHYPEGKTADNSMWQGFVKRERYPSKPILAMIRNPLERFRSAMAQFHTTDVNAVIDSLINGSKFVSGAARGREINARTNAHFKPQILWVDANTKLYKFPDHINEAAVEIGFTLPLPQINKATFTKPTLDEQQTEILESYYAEDIVLFNSITYPGIITRMVSANRPQKQENPDIEE
jgi:hypothetical protein